MKKIKNNLNLDKKDFIIESKIAYNCKYNYSNIEYTDLNSKIILECSDHGEFKVTAYQHLFLRKDCQKCFKKIKNDKR